MNCRLCNAVLPPEGIGRVCRPCLLKQSRDELLRIQESFIEQLADGTMELRLSRHRPGDTAHLQLIQEPQQAYCGAALLPPQRRSRLRFTDAARPAICPGCLVVFDQIWTRVTIRQEKAAG
jgi:hypothetical protein